MPVLAAEDEWVYSPESPYKRYSGTGPAADAAPLGEVEVPPTTQRSPTVGACCADLGLRSGSGALPARKGQQWLVTTVNDEQVVTITLNHFGYDSADRDHLALSDLMNDLANGASPFLAVRISLSHGGNMSIAFDGRSYLDQVERPNGLVNLRCRASHEIPIMTSQL
jgi:hypothetical protein